MTSFVRPYKVRFEDCDPAGIVFYPSYILMLHRLFEDWCAEGLGISLGDMHQKHKIGFPIVNLTVKFRKASRLEEILSWSLEVRKLGNKSVTLGVSVNCQGEERLAVELIVVCVDLGESDIVSREMPTAIRVRMEGLYAKQKADPLFPG